MDDKLYFLIKMVRNNNYIVGKVKRDNHKKRNQHIRMLGVPKNIIKNASLNYLGIKNNDLLRFFED